MNMPHFANPFTNGLMDIWAVSRHLATMNNTAVNICIEVFLRVYVFISLE